MKLLIFIPLLTIFLNADSYEGFKNKHTLTFEELKEGYLQILDIDVDTSKIDNPMLYKAKIRSIKKCIQNATNVTSMDKCIQ